MEKDPITVYQNDHDLLVLLNERVAALTEAVSQKTGDHENRIRWLESRGWMLTGGAIALSVAINYVIALFHK